MFRIVCVVIPVLFQPPSSSSTIMVLGRVAHYAVDAVLISTVIAGVKRSSGFAFVSRFQTANLSLI